MDVHVASMVSRSRFRLIALACVCAVVGSTSAVEGAPLASPGFLAPVPTETDPGVNPTLVAGGSPENFTGLGFSGVLVSSVYRGNSYGPDFLTFTYQLTNNTSSVNALHRLTVSSFESFLTDISMQTGGVPPALVDRSTPDVVGFSFLDSVGQGPLSPGEQSSLLVIETNSQAFTPSSASVIDGSTAGVPSFAPLPAIPEPGTLALALAGLAAAAFAGRRLRRTS